eukprot:5619984-Prymnesium_polylepis.1
MPPFGANDYVDDLGAVNPGFKYNFKGVIGDPLSTIQTTATTCEDSLPPPSPPPSPPPPSPPPPSPPPSPPPPSPP